MPSSKGLFLQNHIAIIWDFDKTLSQQYMQAPLFRAYNIDEKKFWGEVNALPAYYQRAGIRVQRDTCYLGHLLTYVREGLMPGLSNARLRELGAEIEFFPGIIDLFKRLAQILAEPEFEQGDLHLEHYIVSTGLAEMIRGSAIAAYITDIWASEFIETPAAPGFDAASTPTQGEITQIAGFLDNTTKTRAIFEINKGVNKLQGVSVNDAIPEDQRRVPIHNMIYVADGPSDIPSFSVIHKHGGLAYAVYDPKSDTQYVQALELNRAGRVNDYGPAEYTENSSTDRWLRYHVRQIAKSIMAQRKNVLDSQVGRGPNHVAE